MASRCGGDRAGQNDLIVDHGQAAKNIFAKPPAPMAAAMVARPMEITVATRTPAMMTPSASGNSTCHKQLAVGHSHAAPSFDHGADRRP